MAPQLTQLTPDSATILERSRGVLFSHWQELLRLRRAVLKTKDPDDIHDLRVASRRFRAALELYYPFAPKGTKTELRKSVRNLTRVLSGLRNIDEALIFFRSRTQPETPGDDRLCKSLAELRIRELKRIEKALKVFDYRHLDRLVREMIAGLSEDFITDRNRFSLLAYFSNVSIRLYLPIHQLLAASTASENCTTRHSLRISIKKWRYFFEIISQVLSRELYAGPGAVKGIPVHLGADERYNRVRGAARNT
jgi:CHAD domain-containing protein